MGSWEEFPFYPVSALAMSVSISSSLQRLSWELVESLGKLCILHQLDNVSIRLSALLDGLIYVQPRLISAKHMVSSLIGCFTCVNFYPFKYYNSYQFLSDAMSDRKCCQDVVCLRRLILHFTHSVLNFVVVCLCVLTLCVCTTFFTYRRFDQM